MRSRSASTRPAIASSSVAPQMTICSLAASSVSASCGSRHTAQPTRSPGSPYAFDIDETLIARGESVAAIGSGVAVREIAVGLVDEQHRARALGQLDERVQRREIEHRAGRVVRARHRDQLGDTRPHECRDALDVELPAVVEREVDDVELGADRARRLEVGRVVGAHDHRVIAGLEQRRRGREQRGRRARRHQHVVGAQARPRRPRPPRAAPDHRGGRRNRAAGRRARRRAPRSSPRSASRRSETELSERLFVIVSYPSCSGDSTSMGIRRYFTSQDPDRREHATAEVARSRRLDALVLTRSP